MLSSRNSNRQADQLGLIQLDQDLSLRVHAVVDFEPERALDQRLVLPEEQVVGLRPVDAPDFVDVAKSARGEERRLRSRALEYRVDGDRAAVQKELCAFYRGAPPLHARHDALDEAGGRGQGLAIERFARVGIESDDIREGAADIRRQPQPRAVRRSYSHRRRQSCCGIRASRTI